MGRSASTGSIVPLCRTFQSDKSAGKACAESTKKGVHCVVHFKVTGLPARPVQNQETRESTVSYISQ